MRILHINKFAYRKGGAEVYMLDLASYQAKDGHEVAVFGSRTPDSSIQECASVEFYDVEVEEFHNVSAGRKAATAIEVVWNSRVRSQLRHVLEEFGPDVVHIHNYAHQFSSSVIQEIIESETLLIHTAHDYKLVCPSYIAIDTSSDCFACSKRISAKLVRERCHHGSRSWSALVGVEALMVRRRKLVPRAIIAPSQFMADRLQESWLGTFSKISMIRNPMPDFEYDWDGDGGYLLYVGRLSREKGVFELAKACRDSGVELVVAGDGPERQRLEMMDSPLVRVLGHLEDRSQIRQLRRHCSAQLVPSVWPENAPLSVLEAAAQGVPVISARRGGLPELSDIGLKIVYLSELNSGAIRDAIREVANLPREYTLSSELGWSAHLAEVEEVYRRELEALQ